MLRIFWLSAILFITISSAAQTQQKTATTLIPLLRNSKEDTGRVRLLLELSRYYVAKPGEQATDIDSALVFARQAEQLSNSLQYSNGTAYSYVLLSQALTEKQDIEQARKLAQTAIGIFEKNDFDPGAGDAYMALGGTYTTAKEEAQQKKHCYEQAIRCFQKSGEHLKEAGATHQLAIVYQDNGDYIQVILLEKKAEALYKAAGSSEQYGMAFLILMDYNVIGNYKEALEYILPKIKQYEAEKDSSSLLCALYNQLGITYFSLGQKDNAVIYYKKAMILAKKNGEERTVYTLILNIVNLSQPNEALALVKEAKKEPPPQDICARLYLATACLRAYQEAHQYTIAEKYCNELLAICATKGPQITSALLAQSYTMASAFYFATGQYAPARKYLAASDEQYSVLSARGLMSNQLKWFRLDSAQGNYLDAIKHFQQYKLMSDSLTNENKSRQIAQIQIQYETEKKDQDIQRLTQQGKLQKVLLGQTQMTRNVTIGGVILLALLLGLSFNRYRLKQRTNRQLQERQKEIDEKNRSLQKLIGEKDGLLKEKEWLLKEIHHRVKNNLQIVMSLLNTQSAYLDNDVAMDAIRDSQHRMHSMSLIHQKLYQSDNVSVVAVAEYVRELVDYLKDCYDVKNHVRFELNLDPVQLDVGQAVPLGLILNEAISNSVKYAFPDDRNGQIYISVRQKPDDILQFTITDNGVGLPADFDAHNSSSLGMSLMKGLSSQLNGNFIIENNAGVRIMIEFKHEKVMQHL